MEYKNVLKKGRWGSIYTRSASNVHGFEVAGFDDAHSDGVGCGVVTQRHQQIPSTSLEKTIDNNENNNKLFIFNCLIGLLSLLSLILCFLCLPVFPSSTRQPLHIPYPFSLQHAATSPMGASRQPGMTSPATFCPIFSFSSSCPLPSCLSSFPLLSLFPSYSHCHRYMVSAPSRKSACWLGPACWVGWTLLLLGHSCWSDRSQEPGGTGSSEPPSHRGTLRKRFTHDSLNMLQWSRQKWLPACAVNVFKERLPDHTFEKEGLVPVGV